MESKEYFEKVMLYFTEQLQRKGKPGSRLACSGPIPMKGLSWGVQAQRYKIMFFFF